VPHQADPHEARLLERLPEALDAFHAAPAPQQEAMRGVLGPIVRGQMLDLQRFPGDGRLRALATGAELDDYTYLVAGCVGEFWTKLCAAEAPGSFSKDVSLDQMVAWGIRYGKGLQLVNILRDPGKDLRLGRCYLPEEDLAAGGLTVAEVQAAPELLLPLFAPWRQRCREHLREGVSYLDEVTNRRLLYATALPLLLGIRTLALIEEADWPALQAGVKVSRGEVSKILVEAGVAVLRKGGIRKLAVKLGL
jgi:farnesyl-diphosphate farnesyltransferase